MAKKAYRKARPKKKSNFLLWGAIALVTLGAVVWFAARGATATSSLPHEVTVADARREKDNGAFILDVRQPDEWNDFHIAGSTLIPLDQLPSRLNELPKNQEIVVVCRTGHRSAEGRDILLKAGFPQVTSMTGGLTQWKAAGYPTLSGP